MLGCLTLFELAAHPRRLRQHHQPHFQTVLLQEETRHHLRGPEHQVCTAAAGQTGWLTRATADPLPTRDLRAKAEQKSGLDLPRQVFLVGEVVAHL